MNSEFKTLHNQVVRTQHLFKDMVDNASLPAAQRMLGDLQRLEDMVQLSKNPHSIEALVKSLAEQVLDAQHSQPIMDPAHSTELYRLLEQLRDGVRRLSNY